MTNPLLAYLHGHVPCKVLKTEPGLDWPESLRDKYRVVVKITANRPGYRKGEITDAPEQHVWPRDCVSKKRGSMATYIVDPYDWEKRLATI